MRRDKWSIGCYAFQRHRGKTFDKFHKLPARAIRHGLRGLFVGDSNYYSRIEYSKAELGDITRTVRRYNEAYQVQFLLIKHPDAYEVARIA